jgi:hypothetical protein
MNKEECELNWQLVEIRSDPYNPLPNGEKANILDQLNPR